jgi:hypothetical protein
MIDRDRLTRAWRQRERLDAVRDWSWLALGLAIVIGGIVVGAMLIATCGL